MDQTTQAPSPQQPPPIQSTPAVTSPQRPKVLIIGGLMALILFLVGSVFYLIVTQKSAPEQVACTQEAKQCSDGSYVSRQGPKCDFAPCPTSTSDPTADWKTYTNVSYSFEFKYPASWNYKPSPEDPNIVFFSPYTVSFPKDSEGPMTPVSLRIKQETDVQKEVDMFQRAYQYKNFKDEAVMIGEVEARKISGTVSAESYVVGKFNIEVFIPRDKWIIRLSYIEDPEVNSQLFNQILSTFKFLD